MSNHLPESFSPASIYAPPGRTLSQNYWLKTTNPITRKPETASHVTEQFSWVPLPYCSPPGWRGATRVPFPIKSLVLSAHVSSVNSFPSVRQEPGFGPWKGSPFLQQMATLVGFFFTESDILTTRGTQGPACLPMDQTSSCNKDPFVPGLLLMQTTGQSVLTGKEQETLLTSLPFLCLSSP